MHKKYFYWTCFRLDAVTTFSASAHGFWVKLGFLQFIFCFRQQCFVAIIVFATGRHWEGGFQLKNNLGKSHNTTVKKRLRHFNAAAGKGGA